MEHIHSFAEKIGVQFKNEALLKQAFVHRSYINEHRGLDIDHNERLEFLGDAVLELITTNFLFHKYPTTPEGELTSYRAALVRTESLSESARELGMNDYLLLSKGESKDMGKARDYILANTFEAVIGAIYLDQGYTIAEQFVHETLFHKIEPIVQSKSWKDSKSYVQELAQEKLGITPEYKLIEEIGPDHDREFIIGIYFGDKKIAEGRGRSKQIAEQEAAQNAIAAQSWDA